MQYLPEGLASRHGDGTNFKNMAALKECMASQRILESRAVMCDSEHNLIVNLGYMRGIIPRCEGALGIQEGTTRDIAIISRVNKPVSFVITGFTEDAEGNPVALLSRKRAQELCRENYIASLRPGDVIKAVATHLEPFGCFVDIGCGIASLIPIESISVSRISHPRDRFKTGQELYAVVKSIEADGRICLSHKELLGTWEENVALFSAGETVAGIVRSVEPYGIFVELSPNLAGLAETREDVIPGQQASVYIKSILPARMKVKLVIIDTFDYHYRPAPPKYFYEGEHIDRFVYSPEGSEKEVITDFTLQPHEALS